MRFVPGLVSHVGIKLGSRFTKAVLSKFIVLSEQEHYTQNSRSFWPPAGIESSGRTRFSEHAQSSRFVFSANQICQICWEVRESWTSSVGAGQSSRSLLHTGRIVGFGDENVKGGNTLSSRRRNTISRELSVW